LIFGPASLPSLHKESVERFLQEDFRSLKGYFSGKLCRNAGVETVEKKLLPFHLLKVIIIFKKQGNMPAVKTQSERVSARGLAQSRA
jgi:hypothetical protein